MVDRWIVWRRRKPKPPGLFWAMCGKFDSKAMNESGNMEFLLPETIPLWTVDVNMSTHVFHTKDEAYKEMIRVTELEGTHYGNNVLGTMYDYGIDIHPGDRYVQ